MGLGASAVRRPSEQLAPGEVTMDAFATVICALVALAIFDLLALRFGVNSRDGKRESWW